MKYFLSLFFILVLSGCADVQAVKAPCNSTGSNCGTKTPVNHWN